MVNNAREMIRRTREDAGLSMAELDRVSGLYQSAVYYFETGTEPLTDSDRRNLLAMLQALCAVRYVDYPSTMRRLRRAAGFSCERAELECGMSRSEWSRVERRKNKTPIIAAKKRARIDPLLDQWSAQFGSKAS